MPVSHDGLKPGLESEKVWVRTKLFLVQASWARVQWTTGSQQSLGIENFFICLDKSLQLAREASDECKADMFTTTMCYFRSHFLLAYSETTHSLWSERGDVLPLRSPEDWLGRAALVWALARPGLAVTRDGWRPSWLAEGGGWPRPGQRRPHYNIITTSSSSQMWPRQ